MREIAHQRVRVGGIDLYAGETSLGRLTGDLYARLRFEFIALMLGLILLRKADYG